MAKEMKRRDLEKYLEDHGAYILRHGSRHDVWERSDEQGTKRQGHVPRHTTISAGVVRDVCIRLLIPVPR